MAPHRSFIIMYVFFHECLRDMVYFSETGEGFPLSEHTADRSIPEQKKALLARYECMSGERLEWFD